MNLEDKWAKDKNSGTGNPTGDEQNPAQTVRLVETSADESLRSGLDLLIALVKADLSKKEGNAGPASSGDSEGRNWKPALIEARADPELTFNNFITGAQNAFIVEMARRICDHTHPPEQNPIYIYGDVGRGKTHLLSAIANGAAGRALFTNIADMEAELERARRGGWLAELRRWLAEAEILILEDIELCAQQTALQRELYRIISRAIAKRETVVVSAHRPPTGLSGIDKRLRSMLLSGVQLELPASTLEDRVAILTGAFDPASMPLGVMRYLSGCVTDDIRHLKGVAKQLMLHADRTACPITPEMAQILLPLSPERGTDTTRPTYPAPIELENEARETLPVDRALFFRQMLASAENREEQTLALQIALGQRLRELRQGDQDDEAVARLEKALGLLREGKLEDALRCTEQ